MRHQHPTDIATFTIEIAGISGNLRFYGTTEDVSLVEKAIDAKGLIMSSVTRLDAMTLSRAIEIISNIQVVNQPVPQPDFDPEQQQADTPKEKLDG